MKKLLSVAMALMFVLLLVGCSSKNEEGVTDNVVKFCDTLKTFEFESALSCFESDDVDLTNPYIEDKDDPYTRRVYDFLSENAAKITYEIGEVTVKGDKATVPVTFTYTDIDPILTEALSDYVDKVYEMSEAGASDEEMDQAFVDIFVDKIATVEPDETTSYVEFACVKVDDEWKIGDLTDDDWYEISNVISCNILRVTDEIDRALDEME